MLRCCISYHFYIKPQPSASSCSSSSGCISYHFYIKPQLAKLPSLYECVVYLIISTSNHNLLLIAKKNIWLYILSFLHQTTTAKRSCVPVLQLYILSFLHQTTTNKCICLTFLRCISYHFYIKPQLEVPNYMAGLCCISYHFYIKPQHMVSVVFSFIVVYLIISTSNHNLFMEAGTGKTVVYLIISTSNHN